MATVGVHADVFCADAAPDQHAAQEDHDRHDGRRHEQEDELLPAQLNLVKRRRRRIVCELGHADYPFRL